MQHDFTENLLIKISYNSSNDYERLRINFNNEDEYLNKVKIETPEKSEKIVNHESYKEIQKFFNYLDHNNIEVEINQKYGSIILWLNDEEGMMFKFTRINLKDKYKCEDNVDLENAFNEMVKNLFLLDKYIKEFNYQT